MHESSEDFPGAVGPFLVGLRNGMFEMKLDAARKCAVSGRSAPDTGAAADANLSQGGALPLRINP
eukprot:7231368-Karenia_brevis.AAC.1